MSDPFDSGSETCSVILEYAPDDRIVRATWSGIVAAGPMAQRNSCLRLFAQTHDLRGGIADFSQVQDFRLSPIELLGLSAGRLALAPDFPRIVVAPLDHQYGLSRMFQMWNEAQVKGLRIVRSMDAAFRLLGLVNPRFQIVATW
jgi:hypothetical protein